ncbi:MAG: hypothetical protein NVSMB56_16050 [Pyrinomonadaceae bacterium]
MQGGRTRGNRLGNGEVWKGLVAGVVGGVIASVVMNQFQALWQKLAEGEERSHGAQSMQHGSPHHGAGRILQEHDSEDASDDATERLANVIAVGAFDQKLTKGEKETAGTAFHYAFGVTSGAFYGAAAELLPEVTTGVGLPFGAFIWLTADEGVVPLLGLSKSPMEFPLSTHAYGLASRFVVGLTTEMARRATRNML